MSTCSFERRLSLQEIRPLAFYQTIVILRSTILITITSSITMIIAILRMMTVMLADLLPGGLAWSRFTREPTLHPSPDPQAVINKPKQIIIVIAISAIIVIIVIIHWLWASWNCRPFQIQAHGNCKVQSYQKQDWLTMTHSRSTCTHVFTSVKHSALVGVCLNI